MIGKISGRLDFRGADHVLIDVQGVGYIVYVSEKTLAMMPPSGGFVALYTDLLVREDLLQLFGFSTIFEKECHKMLMSVQGVGAKASMAILGALGGEGVTRAILLADARAVQAAPGVGPKLAQRVILELKNKAPLLMASLSRATLEDAGTELLGDTDHEKHAGDVVIEPHSKGDISDHKYPQKRSTASLLDKEQKHQRLSVAADAISALVNLGYAHSDAAQAVSKVAEKSQSQTEQERPENMSTQALIRDALKLLAPKG